MVPVQASPSSYFREVVSLAQCSKIPTASGHCPFWDFGHIAVTWQQSWRRQQERDAGLPYFWEGLYWWEKSKVCQKTRMAIILLFLLVNMPSTNAVTPFCRIYKVLCNLSSLLLLPAYVSTFIVTLLDEGRGVQRHFPRLSQEESGLSSDPYIPISLLKECTFPSLCSCPSPQYTEERITSCYLETSSSLTELPLWLLEANNVLQKHVLRDELPGCHPRQSMI